MNMMKKAMGHDDSGDDMDKDAKLKVLKELRAMASGMMGDDIKDGMMKKVSVAAPDQEGLKMGLDKAKDLVGHMPMGEHDEHMGDEDENESPEEEASESPEDEEHEHMSPEEIDAEIAKLQALKKQKMSGSNSY